MPTPSGQISLSNVNTELLLSATAQISMNDTAVRNLAGVSSGQISMANLQGKSYVSFVPTSGTAIETATQGDAIGRIDATQAVVWTYQRTLGALGTANITSGSTLGFIQFNLLQPNSGTRSAAWNVQATFNGTQVGSWTVNLTASAEPV